MRCGCASYLRPRGLRARAAEPARAPLRRVKKNWLRFESGPLFAMLSVPRLSCRLSGWNSSSNAPPQMDAPPLPVPVGSPAWTMNPFMFRWNKHPS